eukprot:scaffold1_cov402-Prasinococcus_capsulatus_cf.AAC.71
MVHCLGRSSGLCISRFTLHLGHLTSNGRPCLPPRPLRGRRCSVSTFAALGKPPSATEASVKQLPDSAPVLRDFSPSERLFGLTREKHSKVMQDAFNNKGSAFSREERHNLKVAGLLPPAVETLDIQVERVIRLIRKEGTPLQKYQMLDRIYHVNVTLFYKVLATHLVELLPIIYTPTVGQACQEYGSIFESSKGMYLSANDKGNFRSLLDNWLKEPEIIVVTDGGRILGLGDLGAGGMGIPVGKLHLYVSGGGFRPENTLPIVLDCGTDTASLIDDPFYLGLRQPRLKGSAHCELVDEFMEAVKDKWPKCIIQFEDFQTEYALKYLSRYRKDFIHFNDDVQGTAAVVTAGFVNGMKAQTTRITDARIVMFGAGSSAVGVASFLMKAMIHEGLSEAEARKRIYMVDTKGLITKSRGDKLNEWKIQFAREEEVNLKELKDIIAYVKPHALLGLSGFGPAFSREVLETLVANCEGRKPLVFPLSNPTPKAEVTFQNAVEYTKGHLLFAAGSPFDPVQHEGTTFTPSQCNNMFIFPGLGMGVKLSGSPEVTDEMLLASAYTVANYVTECQLMEGRLYPSLEHLKDIGKHIAKAVWQKAVEQGLATNPLPEDLNEFVDKAFYCPTY